MPKTYRSWDIIHDRSDTYLAERDFPAYIPATPAESRLMALLVREAGVRLTDLSGDGIVLPIFSPDIQEPDADGVIHGSYSFHVDGATIMDETEVDLDWVLVEKSTGLELIWALADTPLNDRVCARFSISKSGRAYELPIVIGPHTPREDAS